MTNVENQRETEVLLPGHIPLLLKLLEDSLHADARIRHPAEEQLLKSLEPRKGYCTQMLTIAVQPTIPINIRIAADLAVKNAINKYWRNRGNPRTDCQISDEEKSTLKTRLLGVFSEQDDKIARHLSALTALIARFDYPALWPDLIPQIQAYVQSPDKLVHLRALFTLHQVIKVLGRKRLAVDKQLFKTMASQILDFVYAFWQNSLDKILRTLSDFSNQRPEILFQLKPEAETAKLTTQILHGLIIYGFNEFQDSPSIMKFLTILLEKLQACVLCRNSVPPNPLSFHLSTFIKLFGKLMFHAQTSQPLAFSSLLGHYVPYCHAQLKDYTNVQDGKFLIYCMSFLRSAISSPAYEDGSPASNFIEEYFTVDVQREILKLLVGKYFVLNQEDLNEWESDPEHFVIEESNDLTLLKPRACAEALFLVILKKFPSIRTWFLDAVKEYTSAPVANLEQALFKDAFYFAVGSASSMLELNFSAWYLGQLSDELAKGGPGHEILKRRILWLIGKWGTGVSEKTCAKIYADLVSSLNDSDLAIRLTAVNSLYCLVNDSEFEPNVFLPHFDSFLGSFLELLKSSSEDESILNLVNVLSGLISQIGEKIMPFTGQIMQQSHNIWQHFPRSFLKSAIIRMLTQLVQSSGDCSIHYGILVPIIRYSTSVDNPDELYILEDGLDLWYSTVDRATSISGELLSLYPNITKLMDRNVEYTKQCMKLISAYILLGREDFLKVHIKDLAHTLASVVGEVRDKALVHLSQPWEMLLISFPQESPPFFQFALEKILHLVLTESDKALAIRECVKIFARILLQNPTFFFSFFNDPSKQNTLPALLHIWIDKFDSLGDWRNRKLSCLALTSLLKYPDLVRSHIPLIASALTVISGVLADEVYPKSDFVPIDPEEVDFDEFQTDLQRASASVRYWDLLCNKDPIKKISVKQFLSQTLAELQAVDRGLFELLMQATDPVVLRDLQRCFSLN